jgi:hypothetical protein
MVRPHPNPLPEGEGTLGPAEGDSPIFADHGFAAVPAKIGTVPNLPLGNKVSAGGRCRFEGEFVAQ